MFKFLAALFLVVATLSLAGAEPQNSMKESEQDKQSITIPGITKETLFQVHPDMSEDVRSTVTALNNLDWKISGTHALPQSHSTLSVPYGYLLLIGDDAKKFRRLFGDKAADNLEALITDHSLKDVTLFYSINDGYVSFEDWNELDSKSLLESITNNTEQDNSERRKIDEQAMHVIGWLKEPTLDKNSNTAFWAIESKCGDDICVNSRAFKFSRTGYEEILWITDKKSYLADNGELEIMLRAHSFNPGNNYADYTLGDQVAEYGVNALVAGTIGGIISKWGTIILFLKQFGAFILAGGATLFYKLKNFFKKKKSLKV